MTTDIRTYVLDTNVILHDPNAVFAFQEHELVVPMTVIEEVDRFKKDLNEVGRNARSFSRLLDGMRGSGSLKDGVRLPGGGLIRVDHASSPVDLPFDWGANSNDNRILWTVLELHGRRANEVVLVTRDTNMRLKCDALGVPAEDYQNAHINVDEQYQGFRDAQVEGRLIDELHEHGRCELPNLAELRPNEFLMLEAEDRIGQKGLARVGADGEHLRRVGRHREGVWGIFARNKEQLFALELLLDDSIPLVTLNGLAGTGKTLLAIAAGLRMVADERRYRRMLVSRPIFPLGRDIGFLPGGVDEKLNPWMKPVFDNLELILSSRDEGGAQYSTLFEQGLMQVEPLTYIRGRSIPQQFLLIDEAQNLTPHEVKTVLTRAGEGTKVVLTGDPNQIDHPYVDAMSNGLTYTVERFKESGLAGHVTLRKGERSPLAELAARLL
ncbi:MAG: PhoH-like ATPase [Myxococcota bacterium]|jgi:PhoH-like ATPase